MAEFDMYLTLAIGVGALFLGELIKKKVHFFERFCIPAPVIGGGIISVLVCILHVLGVLNVTYDETIKDICMVVFFTTKLWMLADLAAPLLIMLSAQVVFMILFARFLVFHILGGNYDAPEKMSPNPCHKYNAEYDATQMDCLLPFYGEA